MAASAARGAVALRRNIDRPVAFVRKIPWTAASRQGDWLSQRFGLGSVFFRRRTSECTTTGISYYRWSKGPGSSSKAKSSADI
ncbi:SRA stem-loop-interacting RNA-binding protein, mitochondrial isoform X2 [Macaca fascicularis]|uniref:SRA stem-loop-interacting RNA-binding protein, mitochondrial isoform X2 n=1 Tax=Macaca fascicularis TaxID=9541 RepID=UPI003D159B95